MTAFTRTEFGRLDSPVTDDTTRERVARCDSKVAFTPTCQEENLLSVLT